MSTQWREAREALWRLGRVLPGVGNQMPDYKTAVAAIDAGERASERVAELEAWIKRVTGVEFAGAGAAPEAEAREAATRPFDTLRAAIDADPERRANVDRLKSDIMAQQDAAEAATRAVVEAATTLPAFGPDWHIDGNRLREWAWSMTEVHEYDPQAQIVLWLKRMADALDALARLDGDGGTTGRG